MGFVLFPHPLDEAPSDGFTGNGLGVHGASSRGVRELDSSFQSSLDASCRVNFRSNSLREPSSTSQSMSETQAAAREKCPNVSNSRRSYTVLPS